MNNEEFTVDSLLTRLENGRSKEEGRRKKEEGRGKKEKGRRKREEGRGQSTGVNGLR